MVRLLQFKKKTFKFEIEKQKSGDKQGWCQFQFLNSNSNSVPLWKVQFHFNSNSIPILLQFLLQIFKNQYGLYAIIISNNTILTEQHSNSVPLNNMSWLPFTPPLLFFYNFVHLMLLSAVTVAAFPLFFYMWMYKALCHPGSNLPSTSGTEPASCVWVNIKISFVWVSKWTTSTFGYAWGKQGD